MKGVSVARLKKMTFPKYEFEGIWKDSFGCPPIDAQWLIYGESGNGKTELCVQLAEYYTKFGRVAYISLEQGISSTIQEPFLRYEFNEKCDCKLYKRTNRKMTTYEEVLEFVKKTNYKIIFIDSLNYMQAKAGQFIEISEIAKKRKRTLVNVAWGKGDKPKSSSGEDIEFMVDQKILVEKYAVVEPKSRCGGKLPFVIWEEKAKLYHHFLNLK